MTKIRVYGYDSNNEFVSRVVNVSDFNKKVAQVIDYRAGSNTRYINDPKEEAVYQLLPSADSRKICGWEVL